MDRLQRRPQSWTWHHECSHDCRDGLGCNVAVHYLRCTCLAIRERHVQEALSAATKLAAGTDDHDA